jgi:site-specific DNA-methyltransferase (adenine-specific)
MSLIPDKSIKGIITSPPYNIRNSTGGGLRNGNGGKWPNAELLKGYDGHDDRMDHHEYVAWQRKCLAEMIRVLRDDGVIFYNHKWPVQNGKLQDRAEIVNGHTLPVRQIIVWVRQGGIKFNPGYFLPTYEVIYMIAAPYFKLAAGGYKYSDVWEIPQERDNPHPAPFPIELPRRCIESIDDGIILDPFIGSGTTAIAAIEMGHQWIGIEKSQNYCNAAMERICGWKMPSPEPRRRE